MTSAQAPQENNRQDRLVLYFPINQKHGHTIYDQIGINNGSVKTGAWFVDEKFIAMEFNGVSDYVTIEEHPSIETNQMSISLFVNYYSFDKGWSNCIITYDNSSLSDEGHIKYQLSTFDGKITWIGMGDHRHLFSKDVIQLNTWYHIVTTFDGEYHKLWLNGKFQDQIAGYLPTIEPIPFEIGRKNQGEDYFFFDGLIDEIKIFDVGLNEKQINELYSQGHKEIINRVNIFNETDGANEIPVINKLNLKLNKYFIGIQIIILGVLIVFLIRRSHGYSKVKKKNTLYR